MDGMSTEDADRADGALGQMGLGLSVCAAAGYAGLAALLLARPELYLAAMPVVVVGSAVGLGLALVAPYNPARLRAHRSSLPPVLLASHIRQVQDLIGRLRRPELVLLGHVPYMVVVLAVAVANRQARSQFNGISFWEAALGLGLLALFATICSGWGAQLLLTRWGLRRERGAVR